jgi:hypothetical protein
MVNKKNRHSKYMQIFNKKHKEMDIEIFRNMYNKKGFHLVDVTQLCKFKLGISGWCNDFNKPDEQIYHLQCLYRDVDICTFPDPNKNIDDNFVVFMTNDKDITGRDFIIFMKVKICKN